MTKKDLAALIIDAVDNAKFMNEDPIESVTAYLSTLEPKDKERFAKWGNSKQQSTMEKCWEE